MKMKTYLLVQLFTCALLLPASAQAVDAKPPNIILVMADDQGYGDTGYTGHPFLKTPHLDAMAKESIVFNRFYAGAPVCSPTRASVMTGRTPMRTNVLNHGHYLRPQEKTIAEALKKSGYLTAHFGKWHIGSVQKDSPTSPGGQGFDEWLTGLNFFDIDPYLSDNGTFKQLKGQGSVLTMDAAIDFLKKNAKGNKPLFTVIWFPSPHSPHKESLPVKSPYADKKNRGYFDEITLLDSQVGRLRKSLRDLKIHENTIVWYCSDNGGLVKESSGGRDKKGSIYEGGLRVPALIEWPAKFKHKTIATPASTSDIYPTLLAIAGAEVDKQPLLDGIDLAPIIDGKVTRRSNPIGFWHSYTGGQSTHSDRIIKSLMEAQQAKKTNPFPERVLKNVNDFPKRELLENGSHAGHAALLSWPYKIHSIGNKKKGTRYELYNLAEDPMEKSDLAQAKPLILKKMKFSIQTWQASVLKSLEGNDYSKN